MLDPPLGLSSSSQPNRGHGTPWAEARLHAAWTLGTWRRAAWELLQKQGRWPGGAQDGLCWPDCGHTRAVQPGCRRQPSAGGREATGVEGLVELGGHVAT